MHMVSRTILLILTAIALSSCATMEERIAAQSGRMANDQLSESLVRSDESLQKQQHAAKKAAEKKPQQKQTDTNPDK